MSEWLKELASKASMRVTVSEVRILSLPPETKEESLLSCFVSEGSTEDNISSRFRQDKTSSRKAKLFSSLKEIKI